MPEAIPARVTGTDPVSECDAGVPAKPTPVPIERVSEGDRPVRLPGVPEEQHGEEAEEAEDISHEQRETGAMRLDELGRARGDQHHQEGGRQDRRAGLDGGVAEDVL